jgi:hypothetical protein
LLLLILLLLLLLTLLLGLSDGFGLVLLGLDVLELSC